MNPSFRPNKKLYRSRKEHMIAGVCGGLAVYFDVDPTLVRLIFILLFFVVGSALLIYIILWIIVPLEPMNTSTLKDIDNQP